MRTLDAALEAALDGSPNPYLQLQYCTDSGFTWVDAPYAVIGYKLGGAFGHDDQIDIRIRTGGGRYAFVLEGK